MKNYLLGMAVGATLSASASAQLTLNNSRDLLQQTTPLNNQLLAADAIKKEAPPLPDRVNLIDPRLKNMFARQKNVPVIFILKNQPQHTIARRIKSQYDGKIDSLSAKIRALLQPYTNDTRVQYKEEEIEMAKAFDAQVPNSVRQSVEAINKERDQLLHRMRQDIGAATAEAVGQSQQKLIDQIERLGGEVTTKNVVINAISAVVTSAIIGELVEDAAIAEVHYDHPGEPELNNQATSLGASTWWPSGYDGGIWDVGIIDGGVDEDHPAISDHTFLENFSGEDSHGTGIACMYASDNSTYKGIAFGLDKILVENAGSNSTTMAGADWMVRSASDDPEVINYSWGNGSADSNDWDLLSRFVDAVVTNYGVTWAKSAGNRGWGTRTMTIPANNYNAFTVTNIFDQNTVTRSDDVIWTSSSRGPTLNNRKKPDIAAPGHQTYTCRTNGGWGNLGGTSSAAPKVGAGALLLSDSGVSRPRAIKAVMINTADAWRDNNTQTTSDDGPTTGSHWNKSYGWGYLDLWHAHFHRDDYFNSSVRPRGQAGAYKLYKGPAYAGDKATLVWERSVDYNNSSTPTSFRNLSDLDLKLYNENTGSVIDQDITIRDNVHQVASDVSAPVVVKVYSYSSSFDGATTEPFTLATEENFTTANGPGFALNLNAPSNVALGRPFTVFSQVANSGDLDAHNVSVQLDLPPGFSVVTGQQRITIRTIAAGTHRDIRWTVVGNIRMPWFGQRIGIRANTGSYGLDTNAVRQRWVRVL